MWGVTQESKENAGAERESRRGGAWERGSVCAHLCAAAPTYMRCWLELLKKSLTEYKKKSLTEYQFFSHQSQGAAPWPLPLPTALRRAPRLALAQRAREPRALPPCQMLSPFESYLGDEDVPDGLHPPPDSVTMADAHVYSSGLYCKGKTYFCSRLDAIIGLKRRTHDAEGRLLEADEAEYILCELGSAPDDAENIVVFVAVNAVGNITMHGTYEEAQARSTSYSEELCTCEIPGSAMRLVLQKLERTRQLIGMYGSLAGDHFYWTVCDHEVRMFERKSVAQEAHEKYLHQEARYRKRKIEDRGARERKKRLAQSSEAAGVKPEGGAE